MVALTATSFALAGAAKDYIDQDRLGMSMKLSDGNHYMVKMKDKKEYILKPDGTLETAYCYATGPDTFDMFKNNNKTGLIKYMKVTDLGKGKYALNAKYKSGKKDKFLVTFFKPKSMEEFVK